MLPLGNSSAGVAISQSGNIVGGSVGITPGGPCTGDCNLISGNGSGIFIASTGTPGSVVEGNYVGTNAVGNAAIPNTGDGIYMKAAQDNTIGGLAAGER